MKVMFDTIIEYRSSRRVKNPELRNPELQLWHGPVVARSPDPSCGAVSRPCHPADRRSPCYACYGEGRPSVRAVARSGDRATTYEALPCNTKLTEH